MTDPSKGRLLVVDDNEMNRDMLSRRLRRRDYTVTAVDDGQGALDAVERGSFDLVLLDIMMPGLSGLEVLEILRRNHPMADLPVIMVTAKDQSSDIVEALKLGANDYVTKPLDFPVVVARVETQLALKRAVVEIERLAGQLELRNRFIRDVFGRYLSTEVVTRVLDEPEGLRLGGELREITILVADLRGFTPVAERMAPDQVLTVLNRYLEAMTEVIMHHQGTIQELMGDGILVFFGAPVSRPDDARRAVACAVSMQLAMDSVNEANRGEGLPELEMGIGIGTGEVVVGNIGSLKRAKYGAVGALINRTFRIESFTVGGQILISPATRDQVGADLVVNHQLETSAKGLEERLTLFDVRGTAGDETLLLPAGDDRLQSLATPAALRLTALEGKQLTARSIEASIRELSRTRARLVCDAQLEPFLNLRLRLLDNAGVVLPGDIYAKVLVAEAGADRLVHFTSVAPEAAIRLQQLREQG